MTDEQKKLVEENHALIYQVIRDMGLPIEDHYDLGAIGLCTGHMIFNWFKWERDGKDIPKIHPAQKPIAVLKQLIEIFTDEGDVVIDPCCGSGTTLRASHELGRSAYGFEIDRNFYTRAKNEMLVFEKDPQMEFEEYLEGIEDANETD